MMFYTHLAASANPGPTSSEGNPYVDQGFRNANTNILNGKYHAPEPMVETSRLLQTSQSGSKPSRNDFGTSGGTLASYT